MSKQITLCADDYGQNTLISAGIVHLAEQERINAVSCMVNSTAWHASQVALHPLQRTTYIGLHVNLTHGNAMSQRWKNFYGTRFPGMGNLLTQAYFRRLDKQVIAAEIQAQIDAYTHAMNAYPDFIDGHQHIHQLPVIREALLNVYANCPVGVFIRKTSNGWRDLLSVDGFPKRQLITMLGGIAFQSCLRNQNLPTNSSFSGIYNFKDAAHYRYYFKRFLQYSQHEGLIMCHPGNPSDDMSDPLHTYRHHELNYLMSDDYLSDMDDNQTQLKRKAR